MQEFDKIGEDLFNKLRGRFPNVTIGDEEGTVTNDPKMARFFDFDYNKLGKVSVSISEDDGLTVIYSKDFISNEDEITQNEWYDFLKELRVFGKKRMLDYSVRDITKSNLNKRDYKFLAKKPEDGQMTESKLYGTSKISYQNVDNARLVIKHTESVNPELTAGRTRNIGKIYIESADGERFLYPYKHLSGARAMARHVSEGGKPFDEFGTHIVGLSEEMNKLRKFKNYMGRSAVMAESLSGYMDVVRERIITVKKTIQSLQKPSFYAESFAAFETAVMEDVPADVAENWIDQLTIKQFNEELADVFPYIYKLVSEATRAKELGPDELAEVAGPEKCWDGYKKAGTQPGTGKNKGKRVNKCVPEDIALEQGFERMMGQFAEGDETVEGSMKDIMHDDAERMSREEFVDKYGDENGEFWDNIMGDLESDDTMDVKINNKGQLAKATAPEATEQKTPLGEFILSYFDREQGAFPKGETAVLTMVEKDYGEQFIEPAKAFIEQINAKFEEFQMRSQPQQMETDNDYIRMRELAGLR